MQVILINFINVIYIFSFLINERFWTLLGCIKDGNEWVIHPCNRMLKYNIKNNERFTRGPNCVYLAVLYPCDESILGLQWGRSQGYPVHHLRSSWPSEQRTTPQSQKSKVWLSDVHSEAKHLRFYIHFIVHLFCLHAQQRNIFEINTIYISHNLFNIDYLMEVYLGTVCIIHHEVNR
jgi:hypothetical protein